MFGFKIMTEKVILPLESMEGEIAALNLFAWLSFDGGRPTQIS